MAIWRLDVGQYLCMIVSVGGWVMKVHGRIFIYFELQNPSQNSYGLSMLEPVFIVLCRFYVHVHHFPLCAYLQTTKE